MVGIRRRQGVFRGLVHEKRTSQVAQRISAREEAPDAACRTEAREFGRTAHGVKRRPCAVPTAPPYTARGSRWWERRAWDRASLHQRVWMGRIVSGRVALVGGQHGGDP